MVATYFRRGHGRSKNARVAEYEGRQPMSRAKQTVAAMYGCTQAVAKAALEMTWDGEWHHVGKFATVCEYYDTENEKLGGVIAHIKSFGSAKKFLEAKAAKREARRELLIASRFRVNREQMPVKLRRETHERLFYLKQRLRGAA